MVQAGLLKESPEVVCRWPHLTPVTMCNSRDVPHARAACLTAVAVIMVNHGCGPLRMLLVPLPATLSATLGAVDDTIGRRFLAATWGHLPTSLGGTKCNCFVASGVWAGDAVWLLGGVPKDVTAFVRA
jgi:hypothetical protein